MNNPADDRFDAAYRSFEAAQANAGRSDRFYRIGSFTVRLSFAGPSLIPLLTPALAHLAAEPPAAADLTICAWEGTASPGADTLRALTTDDSIGRTMRCHGAGDVCVLRGPGRDGASLLHARRNIGMYWVPSADAILPDVTAAPFLDIFHWWMRAHGAQVVHAAALGTAAGGVLLIGKGGAGKSTTALACADAEVRHAADDYCLIRMGQPLTVWSLYSSAKIEREQLERFPDWRQHADRFADDKAILMLHPRAAYMLSSGFSLRAILVVRVSGRAETILRDTTASVVLQTLAPSTLLQLKGADQRDLSAMAELAQRVPGYLLEAGTDFSRLNSAITALLSGD